MNAGKTGTPVGTRVRVTKIASADPDDLKLVGVVGELTHPFGHLAEDAIAGLYLDREQAEKAGLTVHPDGLGNANLCEGDEFEVLVERLYRFPICERMSGYENNFTVEVTADNLRDAILQAVFKTTNADGDEEREREERASLAEQLGKEDWTPEDFFGTNPDLWRGDWLVTIYEPEADDLDDTPQAVMKRCVDRYEQEGMTEHLSGRLHMVLDALSNEQIERIFHEDIDTQRGLEEE